MPRFFSACKRKCAPNMPPLPSARFLRSLPASRNAPNTYFLSDGSRKFTYSLPHIYWLQRSSLSETVLSGKFWGMRSANIGLLRCYRPRVSHWNFWPKAENFSQLVTLTRSIKQKKSVIPVKWLSMIISYFQDFQRLFVATAIVFIAFS